MKIVKEGIKRPAKRNKKPQSPDNSPTEIGICVESFRTLLRGQAGEDMRAIREDYGRPAYKLRLTARDIQTLEKYS